VPELSIVGLIGGECFGAAAAAALQEADVVIGASRHLAALGPDVGGERVELGGAADALHAAAQRAGDGARVCLVVSGDPGFFGLARLAAARLGSAVRVHPAPSSVSVAFARLSCAWDDAVVVSAHGRPMGHALEAVCVHSKVAVLTGPDQPPEALGRALLAEGGPPRRVAVCSQLGEAGETVWLGDIAGLSQGAFDPLSVVVFQAPEPAQAGMGITWGRPESEFQHRRGMVTKAEVRAVALGKLGIPAAGVLWDVGAGSGSLAIEAARLAPGLRVFAVESDPLDAARLRSNVGDAGVTVVEGRAPEALRNLPDPDRAFVGGGGLTVLDAALARLRPGGRVAATYASLQRAAGAAERLGHLVQVAVSRGARVGPDSGWRLNAENPVFVCWGPDE
jgi:precorrin-6Y C5,15-methyltransferase (decarboxylating)